MAWIDLLVRRALRRARGGGNGMVVSGQEEAGHPLSRCELKEYVKIDTST